MYALGDQNNDGFADFAVWALGWGGAGQPSEALVEFFLGGNPPSQIPYMTYSARPDDQQFYRFQTVGDLNGDGFIDWQIWRVPMSDPNQITFETYWGGSSADTIPDLIFHGPWTHDIWLFPAGDFNGDHHDDLYLWRSGTPDWGELFYGGNPMDTLPDWTRHSPAGHPFEALPASFGDFNGDGFSDFVSVSPNERITYFYLGGASPDSLATWTWQDFSGLPLEIIPDLNGDRFADIVFHGLQVHFGRDSLWRTPDYDLNFYDGCSPLWKFSLGDINGDGYGDMAAIDDGCNNLWGTLCLYLGGQQMNIEPAVIIQGRQGSLNLVGINSACGLGDVNRDGLDDWAIGAFNSNWDGFRGRAVILNGDSGLVVSPDQYPGVPRGLSVSVYPNPFNGTTTIEIEPPIHTEAVDLVVYNLLGQEVFRARMEETGGRIIYSLDASNLSSGIYLLSAISGELHKTTKLMLLK